jgi:hypothetical protein
MNRNLKALGLTLVAAFAFAAISASSALAEDTTPIAHFRASQYPAKITGTQVEKRRLVIGSGEITCNKTHLHGELTKATTSLTITPTDEECEMHTFLGQHRPATVTMNGCVYTYTVHAKGTAEGGESTVEGPIVTPDGPSHTNGTVHKTAVTHTWSGDYHLLCPEGVSGIEIHVYENATKHTNNQPICTYTIKPQTVKNIDYAVHTVGGVSTYMTVKETASETKVNRTSGTTLNCGGAEQTAKYSGNSTVEALNGSGEMIEWGIDTVTT